MRYYDQPNFNYKYSTTGNIDIDKITDQDIIIDEANCILYLRKKAYFIGVTLDEWNEVKRKLNIGTEDNNK